MLATNQAPGTYVQEYSFQQSVAAAGSAAICFVGGATKGPLNKPVRLPSPGALISTFGPLLLNDSGLQAAYVALQATSNLIYMRVGNGAATADQLIPGTTGSTPAGYATGSIAFPSGNPADGETVTIGNSTNTYTFEFDSNSSINAGHIQVPIGVTAGLTLTNLISAINNSGGAVATDATVISPTAAVVARVAGVAANIAIRASTYAGVGSGSGSGPAPSNIVVVGMTGGTASASGSPSAEVLTLSALTPGTWGNAIQVQIVAPSIAPNAGSSSFDVNVYAPPGVGQNAILVESFFNVSCLSTDPRFIDAVLVNGLSNETAPSSYISSSTAATGIPTSGTYALGSAGGVAGADGVSGLTANDYVGSVNGQQASGLQALLNTDTLSIDILAVPGVSNATVINALLNTAKARGDCVAIPDPPFGLGVAQIVAWYSGQQPAGVANAPAVPFNTSFGALFWSWGQTYDPYNKQTVWVPPSGWVGYLAANAGARWTALAGAANGVIPAMDVEYSPGPAERNLLIGQNNINPFVKTSAGIVSMGNSTLSLTPGDPVSDLSARRAVLYAQRVVKAATAALQFLPNNANTWLRFEALVNGVLGPLSSQGGLAQYQVNCNASTNAGSPPNVMNGYIVVQPTPTADQIIIGFASTSDGTSFTNSATSVAGTTTGS